MILSGNTAPRTTTPSATAHPMAINFQRVFVSDGVTFTASPLREMGMYPFARIYPASHARTQIERIINIGMTVLLLGFIFTDP